MSMLTGGGKKPSQPQLQKPEPPATALTPRKYDPAALNFAQRMVDNEAEIEQLKIELENWRAKATASTEQVNRLQTELARVENDRDQQVEKINAQKAREVDLMLRQNSAAVDKLTEERDYFKLRHARTLERLHIAGKVILDALQPEKNEDVDASLKAVADAVGLPADEKAVEAH